MGRDTPTLVSTSTYLLSPFCSLVSLGALDEGTDWPLPMPIFMSFLAITLPWATPALTNAVFGEVSGGCWITLHMFLPAALAEEVLTLGLNLGKADRVVSTADEVTVIVGTVPPMTTQDEWTGGSTTKGEHSSSSVSIKAGRSARLGLMDMERMSLVTVTGRGNYLRSMVTRVAPS